jgi:hypothetical protein
MPREAWTYVDGFTSTVTEVWTATQTRVVMNNPVVHIPFNSIQ